MTKTVSVADEDGLDDFAGLFNTYETDPAAEKGGITLRFEDIDLVIARAGGANRRYEKTLEAKFRPYRRQIDTGTIDPEVMMGILREVFADTVVLGWKRPDDRSDLAPLPPYSREKCIALFKRLPDLFKEVQEQSARMANYRAAQLKEDAKN